MDDDTPLVPKQRGIVTKYVAGGLAVFGFAMVVIVGIVVLSDATVKKADGGSSSTMDFVGNTSIANTYVIPCVYNNAASPSGCDNKRVRTVVCNAVNSNGYPTVTVDDKTACGNAKCTLKQFLNVQFYRTPNTESCLEVTVQVGECWGTNPINGGTYGCQGQCGAGCISGCGLFSLGGAWSRNCLRHDICSWYFGASGGGSDTYCGISYNQASQDLISCDCALSGHSCSF